MLYTHLHVHAEIYIYMLDTYRRNEQQAYAMTKTQEDFFNKIFVPLTLFVSFERVVQGLRVRGCWRPNRNFNILTSTLMTVNVVFLFPVFFSSSLPARCIVFLFSFLFCSFRVGPFIFLLPVCSFFFSFYFFQFQHFSLSFSLMTCCEA